jgi:TRAP-type C4-dicarboxylate transport system permease small subunit
MERWVLRTEQVAGLFLGAIAAITFASVILRGAFGLAIPDGFDISRLMLAVAMFWGIASTSFRNEHIRVDVLWQAFGPRGRRTVDLVATSISLAAMAVFAWMLGVKVLGTWRSREATFDLRIEIWPFHLLAALGIAFAVLLLAVRLVRLARGADTAA